METMPFEDKNQYTKNDSPNYRIEQCPILGRFLVATRDIKRGEVILTDNPIITGPRKSSWIVCPGCYQYPSSNCIHCGWPVCSLDCNGAENHEKECKILRSNEVHRRETSEERDWSQLSDCLMILRCLLLKVTDRRKWRRLLEMESNWEKWSRSSLYATANEVEKLIRTEFGLSPTEFPTSEILTVQAILDINSYEVRMVDSNVQAAYNLASLVEHNCTPNTHKSICSQTLELTFRAATDIPQGSHISTSYCDTLWPTWHRQEYLQWSKFFVCACERCQSFTELDSHISSFVCMDCSKRKHDEIVPAIPVLNGSWENTEKDYQCTSCGEICPAKECQLILTKAENELSELDKDACLENVHAFEYWLNKWTPVKSIISDTCEKNDDDRDEINKSEQMQIPKRQTTNCYARLLLHPQHSLVLDACHTVFLLYPREDCGLNQLRRKECFGAHLLNATKPLFAGISKFRGTIVYELAMTKATILVHQLEQCGMTDDLQQLAEEVLQLLGESQELLKYEPFDQPEGQLAQTGASQLEQLTLFFAEIFP